MVTNELEQLLNGGQGFRRERAPEPLLLPRIAMWIAPRDLGYVAYAADVLSRIWAPCCWPSLADATAEVIASRQGVLEDALLREVNDALPQLPHALVRQEAVERAATLVGSETAELIRMRIGSPEFLLREAVKRVFTEPDPPRTVGGLMEFLRTQVADENIHNRRNLLAWFLPLVAPEQRRWMLDLLTTAPQYYAGDGWCAAAAASRMAGLLDKAEREAFVASVHAFDTCWVDHVRVSLTGEPARSAFTEVSRALPWDSRFERLLTEEPDPGSLLACVDRILEGWGGAPAAAMAEPVGAEPFGFGTGEEAAPPEADEPAFALEDDDLEAADLGSGGDPPPPPTRSMPQVRSAPPSPGAVTPPASIAEATPGAQSAPERSLQTQVLLDDEGALVPVTQGFRQGARHDVRLWIGAKSSRSISADKPIVEPEPDAQELQAGSMEIVITLAHGSNEPQSRKIGLPVDRAKRSGTAVFSVQVEADAMFVSADIWLQHKGRVFQYLKLNGLAVADPDGVSPGIVLKTESVVRGLPEVASGDEFGAAMVKRNNRYIVFGPRGVEKTEVSLEGAGDVVRMINKKLFNATKGLVRHSTDGKGTSWVGDHDEEAMQLLREMARWGNELYDTLKNEGALVRISESIQFVNLDETDIVPIEYVYDKGYPKDGAKICEGFRDAEDWNAVFATGACSCANRPLEEAETLCPMGFWSLSKIIERQPRPRGMDGPDAAGGFSAPRPGSGIGLARRAVLAAAPNVNGLDVESIKSVLDETYPDRYRFATDWRQWTEEISGQSPKLLILLPHHGEASAGHTDFLEIGSPGEAPGHRLYTGLLNEGYVTDKPDEPGPIVLLLGCETAQSDLLPFHTFARDFLAKRAAVVVATQSSVLGQHAAPVANEFVRQLLAASRTNQSFGRIMRDVRRRMFAAGYLMALALVSFGDSDWTLENPTGGNVNVPH